MPPTKESKKEGRKKISPEEKRLVSKVGDEAIKLTETYEFVGVAARIPRNRHCSIGGFLFALIRVPVKKWKGYRINSRKHYYSHGIYDNGAAFYFNRLTRTV